ncbi:AAA family ATPase [Leeuwenhoekiella parthenopeia]|uniref:ATP-binding protein n=1 Tax=Leeuwenhoekiella parthenopeia TaxID=2890320 RepID=A0ABS8GSN6_9FLAO|nr:AAA family ATPase [Leeuwenhoekiella parthenopeia]MCC4212257.1 ATP-binding protein [Leeuwenhoekiella parthenopeia]
MELRKSERKKAKIKMALQGSSGAGKSYSALLIAKGLSGDDLSKVAVIDTENGSSDLYSHLGNYNVLTMEPPYTPEKYIEAIDICIGAGMDVIILDSISHCWEELIDFHSKLPGNSFTNWNKVTPRQKAFVDKILQSPAHFISTIRTKQDYVLNLKDGKYVPEKVGLKAVQRDGVEYEFTIVFDIDSKHFALASKDRTNLFNGKPEFVITSGVGKKIKEWCESAVDLDLIKKKIKECKSQDELNQLYKESQTYKEALNKHFINQQNLIKNNLNINSTNFSKNGTTAN